MEGPSECSVQVFCRVRPLNKTEEKNQDRFAPKFPSEDSISLGGKVFVFDKVFKPNTTQEQVYKNAAHHIVSDVLGGYNGTIFAYGQTIEKVNLSIHEDKNRVPYVKGATERFVGSPEEVMQAIEDGKANRMVAVTNMNEHSSRSHSVFLITVKQEHSTSKKQLTGKLYLVDLAGSEKVSKTGAQGTVLEEAKNINKSLTALGIVISALAEGTKSHVPYRDSKLTRILQESLGGNSRTTVIICCSPSHFNESETKSTLLFGARAKTIKNVVVVNEELTAEEWKRRYEKERDKVSRLSALLQAAQMELGRWRSGERVAESEWVNLTEGAAMAMSEISGGSSTPLMERSMIAPAPPMLTSVTGPITDEEKRKYEEERVKLYQQLDEKDDEIQKVSSELEKQKQQVLLLDEAIQQLKENEEQIREENSRILKEAEDKQQEGKEMITALEEIAVNLDLRNAEYEKIKVQLEQLQEDNQALEDKMNHATSTLNAHLEECGPKIKNFKEAIYNIVREYSIADIQNPNDHLPDHDLLNHMRIGVSKLFSESVAAKETSSAEAAAAENKLAMDVSKLEGQDAAKMKQFLVKEQATREIKALSERVNMEFATLKNLKSEFLRLILSKCQPTGAEIDEDSLSGPAQKQRIQFLENNLDKLTKVHKQLVRDNADLRVELPKMESRLRGREERIKQLEGALRESKERSQVERKKYQQEVCQI
ncbi:hypothetical protein WR25_09100 [Diploscapter pachys]|uniref:Kinesin-like protein n=1 Tax=Diploscapter pachys TaxID=2018661 RepID=A0A2A2LPD6_9BILA|nr:hypothetical protein WR25_09100 [Diploscapter pachys]